MTGEKKIVELKFNNITYSMKIGNILFIGGVGILIEETIAKFKKFMEEHFPNQGIAAEALHISRSHLNKIINRRDNPSTTLLIRMEKLMEDEK